MLGVALAIQTATSIVVAAVPVLLPLVRAEFHLTFAQAGLVANFPFVGTFLAVALAGWAVDAVGDRAVLAFGGVLTGVAGLVCALAPTFGVILGVMLVMGVGIAMGTPAGGAAVRNAFPVRLRGMVMSMRQSGNPLGSFFAALILPSLALISGWRGAVAAAGGASILVAIIGFALYRSGVHATSAHPDRVSLLHVLTRDIVVAGTGAMLLVSAQMCLLTYLVTYLIHDRRLTIATAAFYLALALIVGALGRVLWGLVSDRLLSGSRSGALRLAAGTGALGSLALGILPSGFPFPVLVGAILVCAVGAIGWTGVQISLYSELARAGSEGRGVGLGLMIQLPGAVAGPFLFGLVIDATGSFRPAWILLGGTLGVAVLVMSAVREGVPLRSAA